MIAGVFDAVMRLVGGRFAWSKYRYDSYHYYDSYAIPMCDSHTYHGELLVEHPIEDDAKGVLKIARGESSGLVRK